MVWRRRSIQHHKRLLHEQLERRLLLTTIVFDAHEIDITTRASVGQARSAYASDVDVDGDLDVVAVSRKEATITWHENVDGEGTFRPQPFTINSASNGADFVVAADLDGDQDDDVLYASSRGHIIAWHENLGAGHFGDSLVISSEAKAPNSIVAVDLDSDGDLDVLFASAGDDTVGWFENLGVADGFSSQRVITDHAESARSVFAADLDGDGDVDVLAASARDDTVAWFENLDGKGLFSSGKTISTPNPTFSRANFVTAADIDGDLDLDVIAASYLDDTVVWYENVDASGAFGPKQVVMNEVPRDFSRIDSVAASDLDGDGDMDIVSAAEFSHRTYWAENTDGKGTFGDRLQTGAMTELTGGSFQIVDLDNDGDPDILAASDHEGIISWHENRLIGDSNDDGVFNTSDLIQVFQSNEYRDEVMGNSTFDEGDWNLDGDFDSSDLVLAFQAATYLRPTALLRPTPRANDAFFDGYDETREHAFIA